jgi:adenosylhomocysteine nucleosidase
MIVTDVIPVLVALEAELPYDLPAPYVKIVTGVGKIKATMAATEAVLKYNPHTIINMGTAGSLDPNLSLGVHEVSRVGQRDMDATPLGWRVGQTPFTGELWLGLSGRGISLTSGDNFVTSRPALSSTLVDMEAYGIAMVCHKYKVIFDCYKYVSDFADESSSTDWAQNCADGADEFMKILLNRSE